MNASSGPRFACAAYCFRLSRSGPIVPVAAAGASVWHEPHPFCWKTASPGGPAAGLPPAFSQAANAAGSRIVTWLRISDVAEAAELGADHRERPRAWSA